MSSGLLDHQPRWLGPLALATVYVVWGSTYLAIRVMVETLPPLLAAGFRFALAGALLYAWVYFRRGSAAARISRGELGAAFVVGVLLIVGGNGLVTVAEEEVPSGLAALLVAATPLFMILLRVSFRERVPGTTWIGVAGGFVGVAILVLPGDRPEGAPLGWSLVVVLAALLWACGSFTSGRVRLPSDLLASTAVQMLCGGFFMLIAGVAVGEVSEVHFSQISLESGASLLYLITVGSLAAFTAYVWLLQNVSLGVVSTYAYVNPVIAVVLGWAILSEELTTPVLVGSAVIVAAVWLVVTSTAERRPANAQPRP